jgi:hypothetical protein
LALSVPLSRFTSRVGGGSAFYVRPKPYAPFGVQNLNMKKHIALGLVASTLFLAGCCTAHQAKHWEYMQVRGVQSDANLNKLADEGWSVVAFTARDTGEFYVLRRDK